MVIICSKPHYISVRHDIGVLSVGLALGPDVGEIIIPCIRVGALYTTGIPSGKTPTPHFP